MSDLPYQLLEGDARERLREIHDETVQVVVTSPPYWGLRDYQVQPTVWGGDPECVHQWGESLHPSGYKRGNKPGDYSTSSLSNPNRQDAVPRSTHAGQFCQRCGAWLGSLGLEPTPELYVEHLVSIFREVRRTLRKDGTAFVVIGDSYNGSGRSGGDYGGLREGQRGYPGRRVGGLKRKDLVGIPWMLAFALRDDGWYLRKDIIWYKEAPMPENPQDRPSSAHEYIFLLAKSDRPYWDRAGFWEESVAKHASGNGFKREGRLSFGDTGSNEEWTPRPYRNVRDVWILGPDPYLGPHHATFPREIPKRAILLGSSPHACPTCGTPWRRVWIRTGATNQREAAHVPGTNPTKQDSTGWRPALLPTHTVQPGCDCPGNDGSGRCVVLDPFAGVGRTLEMAVKLGRYAIGIELSPLYCRLARQQMDGVIGSKTLPGLVV